MAAPANPAEIEIVVNGEPRSVPAGTTVEALVAEHLELPPEAVAVEVNRRVVRRAAHAETELRPGDVVELVTLVGGG